MSSVESPGSSSPEFPENGCSFEARIVRRNDELVLCLCMSKTLVSELRWEVGSNLDLIIHDNMILIQPGKEAYLELHRGDSEGTFELHIPSDHFTNIDRVIALIPSLRKQIDDMGAYKRLTLEFGGYIPRSFNYCMNQSI